MRLLVSDSELERRGAVFPNHMILHPDTHYRLIRERSSQKGVGLIVVISARLKTIPPMAALSSHTRPSPFTESAAAYRREDAEMYDRQAREMGWYGHEALYGLMHEYVRRGQTLLDMGIGTGLSTEPFHRAGLQVSGFDSSDAMLLTCADKGFVGQLVRHDLRNPPYPYADATYDHIVSLAVLHLMTDLGPVFREASRIVKPGGIFGFSVEERKENDGSFHLVKSPDGASDVQVFRHAGAEIRRLLEESGFTVRKEFVFLADPREEGGLYFKLFVAQREK